MGFWGTVGRVGLAVGTGGASEANRYVLGKGYDYLYGGPAQQQKDAADRATAEARGLGRSQYDFYEGARKRSQGYYDDVQNRIQGTPDYVGQLYRDQYNSPGPYQARGQASANQSYYNSPTQARYTSYDVDNRLAQDAELKQFGGAMSNYGNSNSDAYGFYHGLGAGPSYVSDRYKDAQSGPGVDLSGLNSGINSTRGNIQGLSGAADSLRFDPTQTQAIGSLYKGFLLPDETKKGYLEQFYEDSANGTNPYYDRLRDTTSKAMERRAAAGGQFNAGTAMRQQGEALADLSAKEYAERGQLAGQAQAAHQGRLNDLTGQAKTYEDTVLGNRKFNLDVASQQDKFGLSKAGLLEQNAEAGDTNYLRGQDLTQNERKRLDALAEGSTREYLDTQNLRQSAARNSDSSESQRKNDYVNYLHQLEADETNRYRDRMNNAGQVDTEEMQRHQQLQKEAMDSSAEEQRNRDYQRGIAGDASRAANDRNDQLLRVASARAGIDWDHVQAQGGAMSDAEWNAIEMELKRSGIDAATIQSMKNDAFKVGSIIASHGGGK